MAFRAARNAAVTAGGTALSAFLDSAEFSQDIDTAETTTFSGTSNAKTYIVTLQGATLSMSGHWDPTASTGPAALINAIISAGTAVTWVHYPGGTATSQRSNTFSGIVTSFSETSGVGDDVQFSCDVLMTGAVTVAAT